MTTLFELTNGLHLFELAPSKLADENIVELRNGIRQIQAAAKRRGIGDDECMLMINRNYGYSEWGNIPLERMDEITAWVLSNWFRYLKITAHGLHNKLMNIPYGKTDSDGVDLSAYRAWYEAEEKLISKTTDEHQYWS